MGVSVCCGCGSAYMARPSRGNSSGTLALLQFDRRVVMLPIITNCNSAGTLLASVPFENVLNSGKAEGHRWSHPWAIPLIAVSDCSQAGFLGSDGMAAKMARPRGVEPLLQD